jgi:hypothetical protein
MVLGLYIVYILYLVFMYIITLLGSKVIYSIIYLVFRYIVTYIYIYGFMVIYSILICPNYLFYIYIYIYIYIFYSKETKGHIKPWHLE